MRPDDSIVDFAHGSWEFAGAQQLWVVLVAIQVGNGLEVVDVGDFTEMWADGVQEHQLQEDVPFDQIFSGFVGVAVDHVVVALSHEFVESELDHISVDHVFVAFFDFSDLVFDFILENLVEVGHFFVLLLLGSVGLDLFQTFVHEHFEGGQLQDGSVGSFDGEICIVD